MQSKMENLWRYICASSFTVVLLVTCVSGSYDSTPGLRFGGQFAGACNGDGMYYNDDNSYVMCSHSIAYIMPCAPGTRNSGNQLLNIQQDDEINFTAFCDVNLVDIGYAAFHSQANGDGYGNSKQHSSYSAPKSYAKPKPTYSKPSVKVITYKAPPKKQSYAPPKYSQQQKSGYAAPSYAPVKRQTNPGYGQVLGYGQNNQHNAGYGTRQRTYQVKSGYQQPARKY